MKQAEARGRGLPPRDAESGVILINVLVIVMLATSVLAIMLAGEDSDIERAVALRSASQAMAVARGGELSAIAALRRDLAGGSAQDTLAEPWANIADSEAKIQGGLFSLEVIDAQARFNINTVARQDATSRAILAQLTLAAGLPADSVDRIASLIALAGPLSDLGTLAIIGLDEAQLRRLAIYCTVLPTPTDVNLNTASEPLIAALLGNAASARTIVLMRARKQGFDNVSLGSLGIILPPGTGLKSDYFWTRAKVRMGDTSQQLTTLLRRRSGETGPVVEAIRRWRGRPPVEAPPLAEVAS